MLNILTETPWMMMRRIMRTNQVLHPDIIKLSDSSVPFVQPLSDVFCLSVRDLPDAVLRSGADWRPPPNASPGRNEVGITAGVREGIGGAAGAPATLEGWCLSPLLL